MKILQTKQTFTSLSLASTHKKYKLNAMITLLSAFLSQLKLFLFVSTFLLLRCIISGDNRDVIEMLPDAFTNKYFILYLLVLWFVFFSWFRYYYQFPEYGIWSHLLTSNVGYVILAIVVLLAIAQLVVLYSERQR